MLENICEICTPVDSQVKILLFNLLKRIESQYHEIRNQSFEKIDDNFYMLKYKDGFRQLIDFILEQKIRKNDNQSTCEHLKIYNEFVNQTNFSYKLLDILAEHIRESQAKRHYELEVLHNQTKIFAKTITESLPQPQKQIKQKKKSIFKRKIIHKKKKVEQNPIKPCSEENKVENIENPVIANTYFYPYYFPAQQFNYYQPY